MRILTGRNYAASASASSLAGAGSGAGGGAAAKILALIQGSDAALIEAGLINLQIGAVQRIRGNSSIANCTAAAAVSKGDRETRPLFLADRGGNSSAAVL